MQRHPAIDPQGTPHPATRCAGNRRRETGRRNHLASALLALALIWTGLLGIAQSLGAADRSAPWTVLKVYDGDTVLVVGAGRQQVVRLLGIDAPETSKGPGKPGQPYSRKAQQHLAGLILDQSVRLAVYGEDRYQRTLAVIFCGREDVNHAMIRAGLAEVYRGRTPEGFDKTPYLESEARARREGKGMWRQGSAYTSPIRWKHRD
jgi:endonuclease YncB( thermonuclease family)